MFQQKIDTTPQWGTDWWNQRGSFKILHRLLPLRMSFIHEYIQSRQLMHAHVIDVGCGGGLMCEPLARLGANVHGIDNTQKSIEIADHHAHAEKLTIAYTHTPDVKSFAQHHLELFDAVFCFEVLEHVEDVDVFLHSILSMLKPGGHFIGSTLNRTFSSYALGIIAAEHILKWVPMGTHQWHHFIRPNDLRWMLTQNNCNERVQFQGYHFSLRTQTWEYYHSDAVNYLFHAKKKL